MFGTHSLLVILHRNLKLEDIAIAVSQAIVVQFPPEKGYTMWIGEGLSRG